MADFKQIDAARKILGLGEEAGLEEIKAAYRKLSLIYHPDRCKDKDKKCNEEQFKKISEAKELILAYCSNYRYSFTEKEVKKNSLDRDQYEHLKRFYDGWFGDLGL